MSSQPGSSTEPSLGGDEREQPVARDDVVDQLHRALLADRERRHRLREDDRLLQRQHRQRRRELELLLLRLRRIEADLRQARSTVIRKRPAGGACSTHGQLDREHAVLEARLALARVDVLERAGRAAGTARTRSRSAGRRGPGPAGASARLRSRGAARPRRRGSTARRRRAARRPRSARAARRCGSSRRSGRKPWRSPEKRGTCQRSANSSSISSCSLSTSLRVIQRERYPVQPFAIVWSVCPIPGRR